VTKCWNVAGIEPCRIGRSPDFVQGMHFAAKDESTKRFKIRKHFAPACLQGPLLDNEPAVSVIMVDQQGR